MSSAAQCKVPGYSPLWTEADERLIDAILARVPVDHLDQQEVQYLKHVGVLALVQCRNEQPELRPIVVRNHVRTVLLQVLRTLSGMGLTAV